MQLSAHTCFELLSTTLPWSCKIVLTRKCLPCREQLNKVQAELTYTSNKCSALSQENELLRGQPRVHPCPAEQADPLAEQVTIICIDGD